MAHPRGFRSPRTSGQRRKVSWEEGPFGTTGGISAPITTIFPTAQQLVLDDLTVIRMRGELVLYLTVAGGAAGEGFRWAFGMCVVTANAATVGATAVPGPLTDIAWDGWFVHDTGQLVTMSTTLSEASEMQQERIKIDSKAMRKTHNTDVIVAVLETIELGADSTMQAQLQSRMLVKLS